MPSLIDLVWLVPVVPFLGASFVGLLLISFTRTMNRLSKPVAFILFGSILFSIIISFCFLSKELSSELVRESFFDMQVPLLNFKLHIGLLIDKSSSILLSIVSSIALLSMFIYQKIMFRKKGYVLYFVYLVLINSSILALPVNSYARNSVLNFIG